MYRERIEAILYVSIQYNLSVQSAARNLARFFVG
jgi:hypothetical protein